jgi:hypothetical protein
LLAGCDPCSRGIYRCDIGGISMSRIGYVFIFNGKYEATNTNTRKYAEECQAAASPQKDVRGTTRNTSEMAV